MLFFVLHTLLRASRSIFLMRMPEWRAKRWVLLETIDSRRCDQSEAQGSEEILDFTGGKMRKPKCVAHIRLYNRSSWTRFRIWYVSVFTRVLPCFFWWYLVRSRNKFGMTSRELSASAPTIALATTNRLWVSRLYSPKSAHSLDYPTAVISSSFAKLTACQIPLWLTQTFSCYFLCYIHRCGNAAFFYAKARVKSKTLSFARNYW